MSGYEAYYGSAASGTLIGHMQINNGLLSKSTKVYIQNKTKVINKETGVSYIILLPSNYYIFDSKLLFYFFAII